MGTLYETCWIHEVIVRPCLRRCAASLSKPTVFFKQVGEYLVDTTSPFGRFHIHECSQATYEEIVHGYRLGRTQLQHDVVKEVVRSLGVGIGGEHKVIDVVSGTETNSGTVERSFGIWISHGYITIQKTVGTYGCQDIVEVVAIKRQTPQITPTSNLAIVEVDGVYCTTGKVHGTVKLIRILIPNNVVIAGHPLGGSLQVCPLGRTTNIENKGKRNCS